jgi:ABC-2 type transport system permease protein
MISVIKKDILEGLRNNKFIVIFAVFLFFAMFDPIMIKYIFPEIIKKQFPGITLEMINDMVDMTQRGAIRSYMSDVYEIGVLVITFLLCGISAREIQDKTLILPICSGKRYEIILISKLVVYGSVTFIAAFISMIVNYYYSIILFGSSLQNILPIIKSGLLQGLFLVFVIVLLILIGVLIRKSILTGFLTLVIVYLTGFIGTIFNIQKFLPNGLLFETQQLVSVTTLAMWQTTTITLGLIIVLLLFSVIRLRSIDLTRR